MRALLIILLSLLMIVGCDENERMTFVGKPGVYFGDYKNTDTIRYSFRMTSYDKDTLMFNVKLVGEPLSVVQNYCLMIESASTAKAGVHYEELPIAVNFPLNATEMQLPLVLCDNDKSLDNSSVFLKIQLAASDGIGLGFVDKTILNVVITNMLIKPDYWDKNFVDWFGEYSEVKHEKCIELMGHDFPLTYEEVKYWNSDVINLDYWMFWGRKMADYFVKHPTKDEHGDYIEPWEPA